MNSVPDSQVAPLRMRRRNSTKSNTSRPTSRTGSLKSTRSKSLSRYHARAAIQRTDQITPPDTPSGSTEDLTPQPASYQTQFHEFLRAAYSFHPPCDENSETVTLPLNCGDVILIHCVHPSGWADGTLLDSGLRGWLPTNYCEPYEPSDIRTLLRALGQFHEVMLDCCEGNLVHLQSQAYTRGMVAGVRVLLENTLCLNRDAPLVSHATGVAGLRRYRKGMLGELTSYLRLAEDVERNMRGEATRDTLEEDFLDQLSLKAFKIVLRAVKFYDIWAEEVQNRKKARARKTLTDDDQSQSVPPTPPADCTSFGDVWSTSTSPQKSTNNNSPSLDIHDSSAFTSKTSPRQFDNMPLVRGFGSAGERNSTVHRLSTTLKPGANKNFASEKLISAHDEFLIQLRTFMMIPMHASSPNDVLLLTGQTLHAGRQMLMVVDAIWDKSHRAFAKLGSVRGQMYGQLQVLVVNAGRIFDEEVDVPEDERMVPQNLRGLSDDATVCIKTSGECVATSLSALKIIGDFELFNLIAEKPTEVVEQTSQPTIVGLDQQTEKVEEVTEPVVEETLANLPEFPMPNCQIKLAHINTTIASYNEFPTATTSPSTPSTRNSHASIQNHLGQAFTPCTPATDISPTSAVTSPKLLQSASSLNSLMPSEHSQRSEPTTADTSAAASFSESEISLSKVDTIPDVESREDLIAGTPIATEPDDIEATIQTKTFAHELFLGKDGQVSGGTLPALVERLTTNDTTPDAMFVTTFYLTFRIFTTPTGLANALVDRFEAVGEHQKSSVPVKLRVYNVFKQWLESHWRPDCDKPALEIIIAFSKQQLHSALPSVGNRLLDLATKVSESTTTLVPRMLSSIGKTSTSIAQYIPPETPIPAPALNKAQVNLLTAWKTGAAEPIITDFDPLEVARQLTIKASGLFCSILPEELLGREWSKSTGSIAVNVRAMATLSNDLINFITDSILNPPDSKKRAKVIKHWTKVGEKCYEMNNFFVLMQITCALSCATVFRLKKTWEEVSSKTKTRLAKLRKITDHSKNHSAYREKLAKCMPPCVPWIGVSQTDLQMIDDGNLNMRDFFGAGTDGPLRCINFEKHIMTAKVISDLQRFQHPYRLQEIPELQTWLQNGLVHVRSNDVAGFNKADALYRRSCMLEPRQLQKVERAEKPSALPIKSLPSVFN